MAPLTLRGCLTLICVLHVLVTLTRTRPGRFEHQEDINLFETTIRVVGGLLSTHELTGEAVFLRKALDLADRMLIAFNRHVGRGAESAGVASGVAAGMVV
jgi:hypothetical protein